MSDQIYFAPLTVPMVNPATGIVTREWYLLFQAMFNRIGGSIGPSLGDLQQTPGLAGLTGTDATAVAISGFADRDQAPVALPHEFPVEWLASELAQTREQVAVLTQRIQDLQQGTVSI